MGSDIKEGNQQFHQDMFQDAAPVYCTIPGTQTIALTRVPIPVPIQGTVDLSILEIRLLFKEKTQVPALVQI